MSRNPKNYRRNVGVAIFNPQGQIWLGKRFGEDGPYAWQCPQGGIDKGEKPKHAARRELFEETGLQGDNLEKLGKIKDWLYYDFTPEALAKAKRRKWKHIGQRQKWFAFRYYGDGSDVDLTAHGEQEFSEWKWAELASIPESVVPFKRAVYERLVIEFADYAKPISSRKANS
jgi:putative (di)nucleoside polyphosphate hydrolase